MLILQVHRQQPFVAKERWHHHLAATCLREASRLWVRLFLLERQLLEAQSEKGSHRFPSLLKSLQQPQQ